MNKERAIDQIRLSSSKPLSEIVESELMPSCIVEAIHRDFTPNQINSLTLGQGLKSKASQALITCLVANNTLFFDSNAAEIPIQTAGNSFEYLTMHTDTNLIFDFISATPHSVPYVIIAASLSSAGLTVAAKTRRSDIVKQVISSNGISVADLDWSQLLPADSSEYEREMISMLGKRIAEKIRVK